MKIKTKLNQTAQLKRSRDKALLLIGIPLTFWVIHLVLIAIQSEATFFGIINFLLGPLFLFMFIYGLILLTRILTVPTTDRKGDDIPAQRGPSYKNSLITFIVGISFLAIAFLIIAGIRQNQGYSGNPAEMASLPFVLSGIILTTSSMISSVITYLCAKKNSANK